VKKQANQGKKGQRVQHIKQARKASKGGEDVGSTGDELRRENNPLGKPRKELYTVPAEPLGEKSRDQRGLTKEMTAEKCSVRERGVGSSGKRDN